MRKVFCYIIFFLLLLSCNPVQVVKIIQTEKAKPVVFQNNEKVVHFIPMHHLGRSEFYDDVKNIVDSLKKQGFIVYYELIEEDKIEDSIQSDLYNRKFRKITGFDLDSSTYASYFHQKGMFQNLIDQPDYSQLGVTETDVKVDVTRFGLVDAYEKFWGPVELERPDYQITLGKKYSNTLKVPVNKSQYIIIDYRNQQLANYIHISPDKKILVLYGQYHVKGTFEELKRIDKGWKRF